MSNQPTVPSSPDLTARAETADSSGVSRRNFLGGMGGAAALAAVAAAGVGGAIAGAQAVSVEDNDTAVGGLTAAQSRQNAAFKVRVDAATFRKAQPVAPQTTNGDTERYPNHIGNYSKGLPHNRFGEVDAGAWESFQIALETGSPVDFENILLGGGRPLGNPQSGLAFELEGVDPQFIAPPAPPALASAEEAGEMVELYWMALLRDVNFEDYGTNPMAAAAVADLNRVSDFRGPKVGGLVTPQTLFRDPLPGTTTGNYISQFFLLPTPFGASFVDNRVRTYLPGSDNMTRYSDWLTVQDGGVSGSQQYDPTRRYIRNGRDLGAFVHIDVLFQAYFQACLICGTPPNASDTESGGIGCPLNPGNPYNKSKTQFGFGTFGLPGIKSLMCEVAARALKTVWYQKWQVHNRLRPEAFGGLVHLQRVKNRYPGVLHADILNASVLDKVASKNGTYLLPMTFSEGSPTFPAYLAGHATVAGTCVTILKALFDESYVIPNPVQVTPDGLALEPYTGPALTVGGELNKICSNVGTGRNVSGVHWRSDAIESFKTGEKIAISILQDQRGLYNENRDGFFKGFTFTKFDGTKITV